MEEELRSVCGQHRSPYQCPDRVVARSDSATYRLIIHDGGESGYEITFCPWCGRKLR